jgi:acyl-CoA reductase-like NAD-dependent aldehyde dehydrogenase
MTKAPQTQLQVRNPANGKVVATLSADDARSIRAKYQAARPAQPEWVALPLRSRLSMIRRFRAMLVSEAETLAATLTTEMGKPIAQSRNEVKGVLGRIDFFLSATPRVLREEVVATVVDASNRRLTERISQGPLGVVANISAWNYPYFVGSNVFVPALLTGNAVLYKPSEFATLTGLALARLLHASGVPPEIFVPLVGAGEVGTALVRQPVDGLFFTGSYATGRRIAEATAGRMIRLQLELGGKDPVYVCEDVGDVSRTAAALAEGAFYNTGQSCCSVERIYVHRDIFPEFLRGFVKEVKSFKVGDPSRASTFIGPLARAPQVDVLESQVADAVRKGARVLLGGKRLKRPGNYFAPTVLVDVDHTMTIMRDESFGPVIGVMPVLGDDEAVALMNDTPYGLTAGVYTPDRQRAESILTRVRSGSAYWNCCDRVSPRLPWSGWGQSGMGLTLSRAGILSFTRPRAWHLQSE